MSACCMYNFNVVIFGADARFLGPPRRLRGSGGYAHMRGVPELRSAAELLVISRYT